MRASVLYYHACLFLALPRLLVESLLGPSTRVTTIRRAAPGGACRAATEAESDAPPFDGVRRAAAPPSSVRRAAAADAASADDARSARRRGVAKILALAGLSPCLSALAISATTMSGKTRPDTGVVLVAEPAQAARGKALGTRADLVSADGILATVEFESPWPLQQGTYYDVEVRGPAWDGDGTRVAFRVVASLEATTKRDACDDGRRPWTGRGAAAGAARIFRGDGSRGARRESDGAGQIKGRRRRRVSREQDAKVGVAGVAPRDVVPRRHLFDRRPLRRVRSARRRETPQRRGRRLRGTRSVRVPATSRLKHREVLLPPQVIENDRLLEYSFTALSPSRAEVLRRCYVRATSAPGSKDVFAIVAGTTAARWRKEKGDETSRRVADSLRVTATKKTALKKDESSDYRTYKSKMPDLSRQKEGGNAKYGGDL